MPGDVWLTRQFQSADSEWIQRPLDTASELIEWPVWGVSAGAAVTVALVVLGPRCLPVIALAFLARYLVDPMKELVERPRPSPETVEVEQLLSSYSFPSGHAHNAVMLYGLVFYFAATAYLRRLLFRRAVQAVCLFVIAGTGVERVYAGYHWPSDVLGGYLLGALVLAALIVAGERIISARGKG